jgi:hypothetical protein
VVNSTSREQFESAKKEKGVDGPRWSFFDGVKRRKTREREGEEERRRRWRRRKKGKKEVEEAKRWCLVGLGTGELRRTRE